MSYHTHWQCPDNKGVTRGTAWWRPSLCPLLYYLYTSLSVSLPLFLSVSFSLFLLLSLSLSFSCPQVLTHRDLAAIYVICTPLCDCYIILCDIVSRTSSKTGPMFISLQQNLLRERRVLISYCLPVSGTEWFLPRTSEKVLQFQERSLLLLSA